MTRWRYDGHSRTICGADNGVEIAMVSEFGSAAGEAAIGKLLALAPELADAIKEAASRLDKGQAASARAVIYKAVESLRGVL